MITFLISGCGLLVCMLVLFVSDSFLWENVLVFYRGMVKSGASCGRWDGCEGYIGVGWVWNIDGFDNVRLSYIFCIFYIFYTLYMLSLMQ